MEPRGYSHLIFRFCTGRLLASATAQMYFWHAWNPRKVCMRLSILMLIMSHALLAPQILPWHMDCVLFQHPHAPRGPKVNAGRGKAGGLLVWLGCDVAASTPATYQRHRL